ncbi:Predicted DNA binding protein, contains HTH domain [Halogranum amylolyticum]|uniref:Predicted DNA binding protein, contains HTH domain n=1 Tax=Halogranum amylolyticum TaxID=660520 RepID=A0A1H8SW60_9EURY|nr:helix-turn-helix domain-containing protein [Halogranum amylolyticum]SEO82857.1 Predicted DNA binding protein, contains HTH domain [Halogranum amylolyticum]
MSLIAIADIQHADLALVPTIRECSYVTIRVVPHSGTDPETDLFFFHVECDDRGFDDFDRTIEADPTVAEAMRVADSKDTRIYRLRHTDDTILLSPIVAKLGGLMLEAESTHGAWRVRLRLPDREAVASLWEFCEEEGMSFELVQLFRQDDHDLGIQPNLTEAQRIALVTAHREGYFEEPRETSLEELADELDISPTAVGGRLRRGISRLIEVSVLDE